MARAARRATGARVTRCRPYLNQAEGIMPPFLAAVNAGDAVQKLIAAPAMKLIPGMG